MPQEVTCIYCGKSENFCQAHIVPECLGKFKGQPKQKKLICSDCDHEIGRAEEQLAKCSAEAIFRAHLSIRGKKKHEQTSSFRRGHAGQGPIELKAPLPDRDYDVLVEPLGDGKNVHPLPQLVLIDSEKKHYCIRLSKPEKTTIEYLRKEIRKSSLKKGNLRVETVGLTNEEIEFVFGLLKTMDMSFNEEPIPYHEKFPGTQFYPKVSVQGPIKVDVRYFRSIVKIGFHYFLQYSNYFNGHEKCFIPVKRFIRYGKGKIEEFVTQHRGNLVSDLNYGLRPKYYGHFIIGDFQNNRATSYVQLFLGRDNNPPYFKITLATNCLHIRLERRTSGHFYCYYPPENRSQYTGEIQQLGVANKIHVPFLNI